VAPFNLLKMYFLIIFGLFYICRMAYVENALGAINTLSNSQKGSIEHGCCDVDLITSEKKVDVCKSPSSP
jgi:hypothetical protein